MHSGIISISEWPKCEICGKEMDFVFGCPRYVHPGCLGKKLANDAINDLKVALEKIHVQEPK